MSGVARCKQCLSGGNRSRFGGVRGKQWVLEASSWCQEVQEVSRVCLEVSETNLDV